MNLRDCLDHPAIGNAAAVAGRCDAGERVAQRCKPCDAGFDIGKVPPGTVKANAPAGSEGV